jgi:uncharacterized protein (TIGR02246 family)
MKSWHRRSLRVIVGAALFGGTLGHSRPASAQAILEWAKDHTAKWYAAFNAGDVPAIVQLYASDAVLLLQGETFNGRGAIEAFHRGNFEKVRYSCTFTIDSVSIVDHLAAIWGDDACIETPKSGAPAQKWQGRWLTVYQLQPDGSWLIVRDSGEEAK